MDIVNPFSDGEGNTPPALLKNNSLSIPNEAPNLPSFSGLNTSHPSLEQAKENSRRNNSVVRVEKQTREVPKASIPAANQNGHLLADDGDVFDLISSHNQDINLSPAFQPNKPSRPEKLELPIYTFRKHKYSGQVYRTRLVEEHEDPANNMRHAASPPPSAGILQGSFESPKLEREPERLQQLQTVDLTKDAEFEGQHRILDVRRVTPNPNPNPNKAHCSKAKKLNGSTSSQVLACGGEEEGSKTQGETIDSSEDEPPGNFKRTKQNDTTPRKQESNLKGLYSQTSLPPPPTKTTMSLNFGAFRPRNGLKKREDDNQIIEKSRLSVHKHFDLSDTPPPPAQYEHHSKKQKTSHNGSEKDISEMGTNEVQNHRLRRQSSAASGLSSPQTENKPDNGRSEASPTMKDMMRPGRARNRKRRSSGHAQINGGAQQFKRPSIESQNQNREVIDDPIQDEVSNHGKAFKKPSTTLQVEILGSRVSGHKGNTNQSSPPQEEQKSNVGRTREPPQSRADVSPYFTIKRRQTLALGAKDPDKEFDELNEEYYPEGSDKKQPPKYSDVQELSSDEETQMKGHIAPSKWKKGTRHLSNNGELVYTVTQAFSERTKWLYGNSDEQWLLRYSTAEGTLVLYNINAEAVWCLRSDKLTKIYHTLGNRKIIFHKSADATGLIGTHIHLELRISQQSESLREKLKSAHASIGCVQKDPGYLEKAFEKAIDQIHLEEKKKPKSREPPAEDIMQISENQRRRQRETLSHAMSAKRQAPASKPGLNSEATPKTSGIVNSMRTRSGGVTQDSSRSETKPRPLQPKGEFYGSVENGSNAPQSKRVSVRAQRASSPVAPPPPERWSLQPQNMSWQNDWKSSLIFPPTGRNKATVDKQDIERLDEGEFLNDNLLVFYLRKLEYDLQTRNPDLAKRVYFQNPFFYERLTTNPPRSKKINYEAVERWTAKINLSDFDYIIVPVNENAHWYVAIICNVKKFFELATPETNAPLSSDILHNVSLAKMDKHDTAILPSKKIDGISPIKLPDKTEDVSSADKSNTDKSKNCNGELTEDIEEMPISDVSGREGRTPSGEMEEEPIVSDIVSPAHSTKSAPVSKAKQQKRKPPPVRHVDMDSPRIITLDSLGTTRSATCTNLKNYLLAEIKAKTGTEARDPGRVGHTVKHLPQQDNYYDCGLFLLMYVEMFLEKGDDFIKDLIAGRENLDLDWPAASALRANIRDILFDLQRKQAIENEKLREQKRKDKEARIEKAQSKSDVVKKSKPATPSKLAAEEPAKLSMKASSNTSSKKNVTTGALNSDVVLATAKKGGMSATDAFCIAEPATTTMANNSDVSLVEETQGVSLLPPRSSFGRIGSFVKSTVSRWTALQNQHEKPVEHEAPTSEKIIDKSTEPKPAPKIPISHKKQTHPSSSATWEVPESPDILDDLEKNLASPQQSGSHENPITNSEARQHSPELGENNPTSTHRHQPGGAHSPFVIEADEEPAAATLSKPVNNGTSRVNHEEEEDDVMLLDTSQFDTRVESQIEAQQPAESSNGPDNPQEIPESSPESKKDRQGKRQATPHPNPVHTKKHDQKSSLSIPRAVRTHKAHPHESSSSKKRKADSEVDGEREPRSQNRRFSVLDAVDVAIVGDRPLYSIEGRLAGNNGKGHFGGNYKKL